MKTGPKSVFLGATFLASLAFALPAAAAPGGDWHVEGKVSGVSFTLDCHFGAEGPKVGDTCVEGAVSGGPQGAATQGGKAHVLTKAEAAGDKASWAYPSSFMLMKFDVAFAGTVSGDHMTGTITASGRKGDFTAARK